MNDVSPADAIATVIKPPLGSDDARRRREGEVLRRLSGPGVVELVHVTENEDGVALHLAEIAGGRTLDALPDLDIAAITDIGVQLATTVASLHEQGVVHRALSPEHVIVDPQYRVVLCGFGEWRESSDDDPPSIDVEALGGLLSRMLDAGVAAGTVERDAPSTAAIEQLAHLAWHHPTDDGASSLAERLRAVEPPTRREPWHRRVDLAGVSRVVGGIALGSAIAIGGWLAWSSTSSTSSDDAAVAPTSSMVSATETPGDTPPAPRDGIVGRELISATPACPQYDEWTEGTADGWADVTGDGCVVPWRFEPDLLVVGEHDYALTDVARVDFATCAGGAQLVLFTPDDATFTVDALPTDASAQPLRATRIDLPIRCGDDE